MTSKNTEVCVHLTASENGQPHQKTKSPGVFARQNGKAMVKFEDTRLWIAPEEVRIYRDYCLTLRRGEMTELRYPTPYGELQMQVHTVSLRVAADLRSVQTVYEIFTAGQKASQMELKLKITEE